MLDRDTIEADYAKLREHKNKAMEMWRDFTVYPQYFPIRTTEFTLMLTKLRQIIGEPFPSSVLEVGCGFGYGLILWSSLIDSVDGVEINDQQFDKARKLQERLGIESANINLHVGKSEDLSILQDKKFDLIVTQYVLEHVDDIPQSLNEMKKYLNPNGHIVHILPGTVDRLDWYALYRQHSFWYRLRMQLKRIGLKGFLKDPLGYTPPHEPRLGDYSYELDLYRLELWANHIIDTGCIILDYFQTRDSNWVYVTSPIT